MSAAEVEAAEEDDETVEPEGQTNSDDGRPPIDDEETADLDALREEVAEETAPTDDEDGDEEDSGDEQAESSGESDAPKSADNSDSVGDFYVDTLVSTSNMLINEHGREGADPIDGQPLRQMGVDDAVDELLAENGSPDMPPEQQVLLGTAMFGLFVLASKTTVIDDALENADFTLSD